MRTRSGRHDFSRPAAPGGALAGTDRVASLQDLTERFLTDHWGEQDRAVLNSNAIP